MQNRLYGAMAVIAVSTGLVGSALASPPSVVVSVKPIHSLVAGVMNGVGEPSLLITGASSPHTYTLRPSEAEALQNADVVFWVGEDLESFLVKPLAALPRDAQVVALRRTPELTLLPNREGGAWETHDHDHHEAGHADEHDDHGDEHHDDHANEHHGDHADEHHGDHGHDELAAGTMDIHIWLDPANAEAMVAHIAETLSASDPANAARYAENAAALSARLQGLDDQLRETLAPVRDRPYVVFHDAYQYLEAHYDLTAVGSITVSPDRKPSAQRVEAIREKIATTGAVCVFSEPQFESAVVETVIEGTAADTAVLDPLGAALTPGGDAYFTLMEGLGTSLKECLTPQKS